MSTQIEYLEPENIIGTKEFRFVEGFLRDAGIRHIGWHYVLDLAWIYRKISKLPPQSVILDAGGGRGCTQFLLAELGYHVHNVDLVHVEPSQWMRKRYGTQRVILPSFSNTSYADFAQGDKGRFNVLAMRRRLRQSGAVRFLVDALQINRIRRWARKAQPGTGVGSITWYQGNLANMPELNSGFFDAVVSLSSVEHVPLDVLPKAIEEVTRVSKPQVVWAITTSGSAEKRTWWHEPSQSSCFSPDDLKSYFGASVSPESNPPAILETYRNCAYLRDNLPPRYRLSGNNGMPWGIWDPKYLPVGVWRHDAVG